jgi:hypothetical protein
MSASPKICRAARARKSGIDAREIATALEAQAAYYRQHDAMFLSVLWQRGDAAFFFCRISLFVVPRWTKNRIFRSYCQPSDVIIFETIDINGADTAVVHQCERDDRIGDPRTMLC